MEEIDDSEITNILSSLILSFLISLEREMPHHTRKARAVRKLEDAWREFAKLTAKPLSEQHIEVGGKLYNKLLEEFQLLLEQGGSNANSTRPVDELQEECSTGECGSESA